MKGSLQRKLKEASVWPFNARSRSAYKLKSTVSPRTGLIFLYEISCIQDETHGSSSKVGFNDPLATLQCQLSSDGRVTQSNQRTVAPHSTHSSSRMRVIYHNWLATKQRPHPQSVAEISCHSVLSGDRIRQCETSSGSCTRTQISVCKSPFPSAGTTVSLFRAQTVQQRPLLPSEDETRLPDCGVTH